MTIPQLPQSPARTPWSQHTLLYALFFLMGAELFLISPLLATIAADFRVPDGEAAWTVSGYVLGYALSSPVLAALTDRRRRRTVILAGAALFAVGDVACASAPSAPLLALAHALSGVGGGLAAPAVWAYLGETASADQRGRAIAMGAASYAAGQILGVPLGTFLSAHLGWRVAFLAISAGVIMVAALIALRLKEPDPADRRRLRPREAIRHSLGLWTRRPFTTVLTATALSQAARIGTYSYIGVLFADRFGFTLTELGTLGAIVGVGSLSGSLAIGPVIDVWHRRGRSIPFLLGACAFLLAIAIGIALTTSSLAVAIPVLFLWCAAGGACFSTTQAFLSLRFSDARAAAVSWNNAAMNGGVALGTAALGTAAVGSATFDMIAIALALAAAIAAAMAGQRRRVP
ncbi:putative MFS family arabinose efflux permease [Arthrobacter woluwensis]|uniref:MFS transporter n=1 Tax=Arthrobacter woluwensis TaxID=156980 RepID=UPI00277DDCC0|nr:MFS transporter [Arthrobacter woluwensis]MDQ0710242.1 putative MFS family arabinose efflux permease [Arthrobacter woluwensis]